MKKLIVMFRNNVLSFESFEFGRLLWQIKQILKNQYRWKNRYGKLQINCADQ